MTPGAYDGSPEWFSIYKRIAAKVIASRIAQSGNPMVTLTEHFFDDSHAVVIAVNNSSEEISAHLHLAKGWQVKWQDKPAIPSHDGTVIELIK